MRKSWWIIRKASRKTTAEGLQSRPGRLLLKSGGLVKLRSKFVFSIGLLGLLCLMLPGFLRADTIYTYTGNIYTNCSGDYICNGTTGPFLTVIFDTTLTREELENLRIMLNGDITSTVKSFTFTDGVGVEITQLSHSPSISVRLNTDSNGVPNLWNVSATQGLDYSALTENLPPVFRTKMVIDDSKYSVLVGKTRRTTEGSISNSPGTWSVTSTTPEPSSYLLFGTGLLGLLALAARIKRHAPPASC